MISFIFSLFHVVDELFSLKESHEKFLDETKTVPEVFHKKIQERKEKKSQECFVIPYMHVTHRETTTARWTPDQYIVDGTGWFVGGVELENKVRRESSFFSIKVLWFVRFYFRF